MPCFAVCCYCQNGRGVFATKDISEGQTLFKEEPLLHPSADSEHKCYHCGAATDVMFPCDRCPDALFCSTECKDIAMRTYHNERVCCAKLVRRYMSFGQEGRKRSGGAVTDSPFYFAQILKVGNVIEPLFAVKRVLRRTIDGDASYPCSCFCHVLHWFCAPIALYG